MFLKRSCKHSIEVAWALGIAPALSKLEGQLPPLPHHSTLMQLNIHVNLVHICWQTFKVTISFFSKFLSYLVKDIDEGFCLQDLKNIFFFSRLPYLQIPITNAKLIRLSAETCASRDGKYFCGFSRLN